ncbi:AraC family transcriptional regulator [uncultured Clostridium sp.]|uniref:AraC family transcriptional regulator n=1 Tax=uncultured Clostridium sp. TaxID=59620 RepID=UPI00260F09C6|nr:AraC family transcriptional regulator [uncultured Clostridium sp.]
MRREEYEKINLNNNIPAFIVYFGEETTTDVNKSEYIAPHWHRSIELTFITKGELKGRINGKSVVVGENEFNFVNSGDVHEFKKEKNTVTCGVVLIISYEFVKRKYPNIDNIRFDINKEGINKDRLKEIFLDLKEYYLNPQELDYLKINGYIYEILYLLVSSCIEENLNNKAEKYFIYRERQREILTYIHENYNQSLSLDFIAKNFYMNKEYFSRKFHEWFGVNFKSYLDNFRLYKAYKDIINTSDNIQIIASRHGFSNARSFTDIFRETYDATPNKYRQALKESKNGIKKDKK